MVSITFEITVTHTPLSSNWKSNSPLLPFALKSRRTTMYHALIRSKLTQALEGLNKDNFEELLAGMDPQVEHYFAGTHAIGGTRHSTAGVERWFGRVFRLLPDLAFKVKRIAVSGWPWDTTATAEWRGTATSVIGEPYLNDGVHIVRLRMGKIVSMHVYQDTQVLANTCRHMTDKGIEEAAAPPIED
jgi:ketosteroid isomerase-like protein